MIATALDRDTMTISVDGKPVLFQGPGPRRKMGRVLVPLRGIFERMGAHVKWDDDSQTVFADRNDVQVELSIGSNNATLNGRAVLMDVPAQLIDGSTFVPLRFVSESLGARVNWDPRSGNINIVAGYPHHGHADDPVRTADGG
jgi:hypothetical protein